jgi:glycogen(starch) synthase
MRPCAPASVSSSSAPAQLGQASRRLIVGSTVASSGQYAAMPRLLLLTPSELTRDPRARRAAAEALRRKVEVVAVCGRLSGEEPVALEGVRVIRTGPRGRPDPLVESGLRRQRPLPSMLREARGLYRLARLVLRTGGLWRGGRLLGPVDIVHANDFDTLPAGWLLARSSRARLVYDAHELYSEFEPDPPRVYRAATTRLEGALARRADAVATVSGPLREELVRRLRLTRPPAVVLNLPELHLGNPPVRPSSAPLQAIYQGSFGTGRPLRQLLDAISLAPSIHLTLRPIRIERDVLRSEIEARGLGDRVDIADQISPAVAVSALHEFDVGIIFDRPVTLNGELSLPNKLFEYLMAGLAVVAPRLPGIAPLIAREGVGLTFEPTRSDGLAAALEEVAGDRGRLAEMRTRARRAAVERYNAEAQSATLAALWGLR